MKIFISLFLSLSLLLSTPLLCALAIHNTNDANVTQANELHDKTFKVTNNRTADTSVSLSDVGKSEIISAMESSNKNPITTIINPQWQKEPSTTSPYVAGELTSDTNKKAFNYIKMARFLTGLDTTSSSLDSGFNTNAQHGATLLAINGNTSKPNDMASDFYTTALNGCKKSITLQGLRTLDDAIRTALADSDVKYIKSVPNRLRILKPSGSFGIGYSSSVSTGTKINIYTDDTNTNYTKPVAWPSPGDFPIQYFTGSSSVSESSRSPWSISLGNLYSFDRREDVTITLSKPNSNETIIFDQTTKEYTENDGYIPDDALHFGADTSTNTLTFRPKVGTINNGDKFDVNIKGLKNNVELNYSVTFFDILKGKSPMRIDRVTPKNVSVYNGNDGQIEVTMSGGSESYEFDVFKDGSKITPTLKIESNKTTITNLSSGKYKIIISDKEGITGSLETQVELTHAAYVAVTAVSIPYNLTLIQNASQVLTPTITPVTASNKAVKWESLNTAIATVDNTGKVTGKNAGTANIQVTTIDGGKTSVCKVTVESASGQVSGVTISKTSETVEIGKNVQLTAAVVPTNAKNKTVTWSTSNKAIATVSTNGSVSGVSKGIVVITVTTNSGSKSASCVVTVTDKKIPVTSVKFTESAITLQVGDRYGTLAIVAPENATDKTVTYKTSNANVATVDTSGVITAKSEGKVIITATTNDAKKTTTCQVNVSKNDIPVTNVSLQTNDLDLEVGDFYTLKATVYPTTASNNKVTWKSSDTSIATVDTNGRVTAKAYGEAVIIVSSVQGGQIDMCTVNVQKPQVSVRSVSISLEKVSLYIGKTSQLKATVSPSNASNKKVFWKSSNTKVATVSSSGKITAKSAGTARITATTDDNDRVDTCTVTVKKTPVAVKSVKMSSTKATVYIGKTRQLKVTISPSSATNKKVTWKSSNTRIATVDSGGKVIGKAKGTVKITATTVDGKKVASCIVTSKTLVLSTPKLTAKKANGARYIQTSWKAISYADGYELYRSKNSKSGFSRVTTAKKTTLKYNDKRATKGTYYLKLRAYTTVNGRKVYSKYSTLVKVKV